jgi:hypothetical protein
MLARALPCTLAVTEPPDRPESAPVALSRLIDELRADPRWREEIAASRAGARATGEGPGGAGATTGGARLEATLAALEGAIAEADAVVPIEPGRLVVGDAWARLRRQIHAEIRIYQDRQTTVNREVAAALGQIAAELRGALDRIEARIEERLGATDALAAEIEPLGAVRLAVEQLEARLSEVERWRGSG